MNGTNGPVARRALPAGDGETDVHERIRTDLSEIGEQRLQLRARVGALEREDREHRAQIARLEGEIAEMRGRLAELERALSLMLGTG